MKTDPLSKGSPLWASLALLLVACGDINQAGPPSPIDTTGTDAPATLATPVDGARAAAAMLGFINGTGGLALSGSGSGSGKATTTQPCDIGSRTLTTDDSTPNTQDGRTQFDNCTEIVTQSGVEVLRTIENGVRRTRCEDAGATNPCQDEIFLAGEEGQPYSLEILAEGSHQRLLALGSGRETVSGDRSANGAQQYDNLLSHRSATLVFDPMLLFSDVPSGNRSVQVGGTFALNEMARATASCISGRLTVETLTALSINQNEAITGGQLQFTSTNGNTAVVTFQASGSLTANVNGTATTFSPSQVAAFCSIQ